MAFFLHYTPHSDFEHGIFVPFATQVEAERQAAYDLQHGVDPEYIESIFEAPFDPPKFAWTKAQVDRGDAIPVHLTAAHRTQVHTRKKILSLASKHQEDMHVEMVQAHIADQLAVKRAIEEGTFFKGAVPGNAYNWMIGGTATAGASALAGSTAKTVVLLLAASANQMAITEIGVSFDGVTASAVPVLVELVSGTAGGAGTPRATLASGKQLRGWPAQASATTCGDTYSAEPTTQLVNRKWLVSPNGGLFVEQFPLGREPTGIITAATDAKTWSLRLTAPAAVNCHAYIEFEE